MPQPVAEVGEQVEDLRADRDVERRDRLVEDDQRRLDDQRAGDGDALALAAGEFVRCTFPRRPASRPTSSSASAMRRCALGAASARLRRADGTARPPAGRRAGADRTSRRGPGTPPASCGAPKLRAALSASSVSPSKRDRARPAIGSSAMIARASVDLPQPLSPTSPTFSPRSMREADVVDGAEAAGGCRTGCGAAAR